MLLAVPQWLKMRAKQPVMARLAATPKGKQGKASKHKKTDVNYIGFLKYSGRDLNPYDHKVGRF